MPVSSPLLTTRLHIPRPARPFDWSQGISFGYLQDGVGAAPAGLGKTMLLSEWIHTVGGASHAARQIREGYAWAGCPERFRSCMPPRPHCYDAEVQAEALTWFDRYPKAGESPG